MRMKIVQWALIVIIGATTLATSSAQSTEANRLVLNIANHYILTENDIDRYDLDTHTIHLRPDLCDRFSMQAILELGLTAPFQIAVDGELIYGGHFLSMLSSYMPPRPHLMISGARPGEIRIGPFENPDEDRRSDPRIMQTLSELGKLDHQP